MSNKFSKEYEIYYHDVDQNLQCKLSSIANYLTDVSNAQSENLGETIQMLIDNNYAWVIYKYDITMYEYPKYRDVISIESNILGVKKFYGFRGYLIINSKGTIIGEATALAFLINIEKRRPMRLSPEQYKRYGLDCDLKDVLPMDDILDFENADYFNDFPIRLSDIDSNGHVNNVKYIEMAIESIPSDVIRDYSLSRLKIIFKKETTYGDTVHLSSKVIINEDNKITTLHTLTNNSEKEITKLELTWTKE